MSVATLVGVRGIPGVARDYVSLLKLRIVLLLDATAVGVMFPAAHGHPNWHAVIAGLVGGPFAAGAAHPINSWFDRATHTHITRPHPTPLPPAPTPPSPA